MSKLEVVVGAQFGSEAKGHVVQRLTERAQSTMGTPTILRVAGPNAGHTGYDAGGRPWALRQVPVAAVTEGNAMLGVAAGSEVDPEVLLEEIDNLTAAGLLHNKMLWVHGEATIISAMHKERESSAELVRRIGSTGKGIGAARANRLMRQAERVKDNDWLLNALAAREIPVAMSKEARIVAPSSHVIIEGTQGYGLGLHAGYYPQCTSSDCRAVDFMAMAGIHPWQFDEVEVWAVARMFPIRVAGNSGPLKDETTWESLGLPEERTTVTKKVRRVGKPDWDLVRRAVAANGGAPTVRVALTMVDQMFPTFANMSMPDLLDLFFDGDETEFDRLSRYMKQIETQVHAKIGMITTGPNAYTWVGGGEGA